MLTAVILRMWLLQRRRRARRRQMARRTQRLLSRPVSFMHERRRVFRNFYRHLRRHHDKFFDYLWMSEETFDALLSRVRHRLEQTTSYMRDSVSLEEMLLVTLRYLAKGHSFSNLHLQFLLNKYTISGIVKDTCKILWDVLQPEVLPHPTTAGWLRIAEEFQEETQFPNCVGAIDGKHIRLLESVSIGSTYHQYKDYSAVILMAIADTTYRFVAVDFATFNQGKDFQVFKTSKMGRNFYCGRFGLPLPRPLPGTQEPVLPFVIAGSQAFQTSPNLLTPYSGTNLDGTKSEFNQRLNEVRHYVDISFTLLTERWEVLTKRIHFWPENVQRVAKACVVLHNFILPRQSILDDYPMCDLLSVSDPAPGQTIEVMKIQNQFAAYFSSPKGRLPEEDNYA